MKGKPLENLVNSCLNMLQNGIVPWKRGWKLSDMPMNLITKKRYRGINMWHLMMLKIDRKWNSPYFLTKTQALTLWGYKYDKESKSWVWDRKRTEEPVELDLLGKGLKKSPKEKANLIVFWKWYRFKKEFQLKNGGTSERWVNYPKVLFYWGYNTNQLNLPEGKIPENKGMVEWTEEDLVEKADNIIKEYVGAANGGPKYSEEQTDRAYYHPSMDEVVIPSRGQFTKIASFYCTAFHELGHSTGHKDRLKRKEVTDPIFFGSHEYSKEELVAEMTASLLAAECGIQEETMENSAAYLAHWVKKLQQQPEMLWQAAQMAQKASDHILKVTFDGKDKDADGTEETPKTVKA